MQTLVTILVVTSFATLGYIFVAFDRLVRWQYEHHRKDWERDGRPDGFAWRANECSMVASDFSKKRLSFVWTFRTPGWATSDTRASSLLWQFRAGVLAWFVLAPITFYVFKKWMAA